MASRLMKDSCVEWIGEIPTDWRVVALKHVATLNDESLSTTTSDNFKFNYIDIGSVSLEKGVHTTELISFSQAPSRARRIVRKNDIIISTVRTYLKAIAIISEEENTIVSTGFAVIRPHDIVPLFLSYAIKSEYFTESVSAYSYGVAYPSINTNVLMSMKIAIPSKNEQQKIATFLDEKIVHIDSILEDTKKSIEYLKAYKQSLITEVVTKGLNANVEMKDSGVEWIGQIPKHWDLVRLKMLIREVNERNDDENALLLSLFTSIGVKPRNEMEDRGNKSVTVINYKNVERGDIVVNKLLAWMGSVGYSDYSGVTSPDYDVYRALPNANIDQEYYNLYFRHTNFKDDCYKYGRGIMMMRWRTYPEQFLNIRVVNPPLEEQKDIAIYLDEKSTHIDNLIKNKIKMIKELESYKKSLIYEYVTGKKEVQ